MTQLITREGIVRIESNAVAFQAYRQLTTSAEAAQTPTQRPRSQAPGTSDPLAQARRAGDRQQERELQARLTVARSVAELADTTVAALKEATPAALWATLDRIDDLGAAIRRAATGTSQSIADRGLAELGRHRVFGTNLAAVEAASHGVSETLAGLVGDAAHAAHVQSTHVANLETEIASLAVARQNVASSISSQDDVARLLQLTVAQVHGAGAHMIAVQANLDNASVLSLLTP